MSTIWCRSPKKAPVDGIPPTSVIPVDDLASGSHPVGVLARPTTAYIAGGLGEGQPFIVESRKDAAV